MTKSGKQLTWRPPAGTQALTEPDDALSQSDTQLAGAATQRAGVPKAQEIDVSSLLSRGEPFKNGTIIGDRYVIERHISSGSFGAVYKARDASIEDHAVALKVLHGSSSTETARNKALRELQLIASVSHPSVVQFKDYGWIGNTLWFTMTWYGGKTLHDRLNINQNNPLCLNRAEAKPIFERLAHGMAAMHEVGVFHHDIKPENIFLADVSGFKGGLPVLLDLGIASKEGEKPVGFTANYVSPETASSAVGFGSAKIGAAADVFSLALCLRNTLEPSTAPASEGNYFGFLEQRATKPISPPRGRDVRYLAPSFKRWLSLNPSKRPTAKKFADELKTLTAPEDRRRTQLQLVKRLIPVVLLAAALVALLAFQLTRTEELLSEKEERLEETSEELSIKAMEANLLAHKTEEQRELLVSEAARATQNERIAKKLDKELEATSQAQGKLSSALVELKSIHVDLLEQHDSLSAETEALRIDHTNLELAHSEVVSESTALKTERAQLLKSNQSLEATLQSTRDDQKTLNQAIQKLKQQITDLETRIGELKAELANKPPANQPQHPPTEPPKSSNKEKETGNTKSEDHPSDNSSAPAPTSSKSTSP